MSLLAIYKRVEHAIPSELREKYGHLSYGEMAEIDELAPWAETLLRAEDEWNSTEAEPWD